MNDDGSSATYGPEEPDVDPRFLRDVQALRGESVPGSLSGAAVLRRVRLLFAQHPTLPLVPALLLLPSYLIPFLPFFVNGASWETVDAVAEADGRWLDLVFGTAARAALLSIVVARMRGLAGWAEPFRGIALLWIRLIGIGLCTGIAVVGGLLLLIVPGLIVATAFSLAPAIAASQRWSVFESLEHSWKISRGSRWVLFAVLLVPTIVYAVASGLATFALYGPMESATTPEAFLALEAGLFAGLFVLELGYQSLACALQVASYEELRQPDPVDASAVAEVFT